MNKPTTLEDIIGLEYTKLGFFGEVKKNMAKLQATNRKLERKQRKLEAIFGGISDVMVILSANFTIISTNDLFSTVFKHASPRGHFCYEIFKKRDCPCSDCPISKARQTNKVCRKTMALDIEDKHYQFDVTVSPLRDAKKKAFRFLVLMRDVTREKEYQSKYSHSKKMATVGALAAGVAHEINNPLTSISGFTKGLQRRLPILNKNLQDTEENQALMEDFTEYIDTILTECDRCRDIVQGLLTFSPRKKVDFTSLNLKRIVTGVLRLLHHRFKENPQVAITLKAEKNIPHIMGNAAELKQVILNLICNSLDAVDGQGFLELRLYQKENQIIFSIEDDGCGIDPEIMDQLFDPFFTTKPIGQGIGIGLSTCYNIIRQHQGELLVKSNKKEGAVFTMILPHPDEVMS
ncbi:PAS fold-containing protein [Desulfocicer vacuolatum DSM 3385]|uniref:histidine kinase n=1 Tax=Desulfocicer vacuolatum DSM 3385 TaxID=1121400 RepID=A0A1W2EG79_9BACT|nr:ATP-binding protein [Desulfocicer vacuolatum]SMD08118.1 PAS fold-containing protein [Desulfocicer vacuolatum DSM 3385]